MFWDITEIYEKTHDIFLTANQYIKNFIFYGSHFHLWYILALIFAIILLYLAYTNKKIKVYFTISLLLYLISLLGDSYFGLIKNNDILLQMFRLLGTTRNGLFFAFPFVMMGAIIYLKPYKNKYNYIFSILIFLLLIIDTFILKLLNIPKDYNLYLMLIPFTYFFFNYLISLDIKINNNITLNLRSYSMGIYFIHGIFLILFDQMYLYMGITNYYTINFMLVTASSILLIWIIKKLNIPIIINLIK